MPMQEPVASRAGREVGAQRAERRASRTAWRV